ncbi:MAG TPA: FhaA domain-containing protein [Candidatus Baltobacteraceae bacterium]
MSLFARIEEACAAFIERAFAKTFPSDLEPAQIARKLVATMETRTQNDDGRMSSPSHFTVLVHTSDFERLAPHREYLEREWAALLADVAGRVGITFGGVDPVVELDEQIGIVAGSVEIEAWSPESPEPANANGPSHNGFVLRMVKGVPPDAVYALKRTTRVGRSEDRDLFLVDPSVSRAHAIIETDAGWPVLHDLGSTNGTFVNGERISSQRLENGDVVAFGNTQLRFEALDP